MVTAKTAAAALPTSPSLVTAAAAGQKRKITIPPPVIEPFPWTWRCHKCWNIYRLSCTRRCLECSHVFCSGASKESDKFLGGGSSRRRLKKVTCMTEFDFYGWAVRGAYRRTAALNDGNQNGDDGPRKRQRRDSTEKKDETLIRDELSTWVLVEGIYDEMGDPEAMDWLSVSEEETARVARRKQGLYLSNQYNCWLHCDSPSECLHSAYNA
ncbi:hypothetical protein B0T17DRAFT_498275, partial [Bombardia bombarda]